MDLSAEVTNPPGAFSLATYPCLYYRPSENLGVRLEDGSATVAQVVELSTAEHLTPEQVAERLGTTKLHVLDALRYAESGQPLDPKL